MASERQQHTHAHSVYKHTTHQIIQAILIKIHIAPVINNALNTAIEGEKSQLKSSFL